MSRLTQPYFVKPLRQGDLRQFEWVLERRTGMTFSSRNNLILLLGNLIGRAVLCAAPEFPRDWLISAS